MAININNTTEQLNDNFQKLAEDASGLSIPSSIAELWSPPSPMVFLREYVMPNIPLVIRGGVQNWPALKKWTDDYLCSLLGEF